MRLLESPSEPGFTLSPGATVHGYRLCERLGAGGFGEVWRAENLDGESFALKFCRHLDLAAAATLRREIDLFLHLRSARGDAQPPIVALKQDLLGADPPVLVMEFVGGGDLRRMMSARGFDPMPLGATLPVVRDVLAALEFAHSHGVLHRDLSPENVLFDPRRARWMVADFGLGGLIAASELSFARSGRSAQMSAGVAGKLDYMSPEQKSGGAVGPSSDLYSLGVIWVQLLTGRLDAGLTAMWARRVPAPALPFLDRCLEHDADERWPTAAALAEALDDALEADPRAFDGPAAPRPSSSMFRALVPPPRRPRGLRRLLRRPYAIAAGLAVLLGAIAGAYALRSRPTEPLVLESHRVAMSIAAGDAQDASRLPAALLTEGGLPALAPAVAAGTDEPQLPHWAQILANPWRAKQDVDRAVGWVAEVAPRIDTTGAAMLVLRLADPGDTLPNKGLALLYQMGVPQLANAPERAFQTARDLYTEIEPLARDGQAEAAFMLGFLLEYGIGRQADELGAAFWFRQAAESGHAGAMNELGQLYELRGTEEDLPLAADWYRRAADAGHARAARHFARMLTEGRGVEADPERAAAYMKAAAEAAKKQPPEPTLEVAPAVPTPPVPPPVERSAPEGSASAPRAPGKTDLALPRPR